MGSLEFFRRDHGRAGLIWRKKPLNSADENRASPRRDLLGRLDRRPRFAGVFFLNPVRDHPVVKLVDTVLAGGREKEWKHAVEQASDAAQDHFRTEPERHPHML